MRSKLCLFTALIFLIFVIPGCYNAGMFASVNITNVNLEAPNYSLIAKNIAGEAEAGYVPHDKGGFLGEEPGCPAAAGHR